MTDIKDLEERIEGAEDALAFVKDQLAGLKTHLQELKEQEDDKQPEPLFGRWATAPNGQRVLIASDKPDDDKEVPFIFYCDNSVDGGKWEYERLGDLTLDPATLTTEQDFKEAPEGTIAEATMYPHDVAVKTENCWYKAGNKRAIAAAYMPACRVIRWGNGQ